MPKTKPIPELTDLNHFNFWNKVDKQQGENACWLWTASKNSDSYGCFALQRHMFVAHRVSYFIAFGEIPAEIDGKPASLDHLCRTPACVRPDHLELVTHKVNLMRGISGIRAARTHCPKGHEYTGANVLSRYKGRGGKRCRSCHSAGLRALRARRTAEREKVRLRNVEPVTPAELAGAWSSIFTPRYELKATA